MKHICERGLPPASTRVSDWEPTWEIRIHNFQILAAYVVYVVGSGFSRELREVLPPFARNSVL